MKFIVAVDGSPPSERALHEALQLARAAHAALDVVIVIEEPPVSLFSQVAGLDPAYFRTQLEAGAAQAATMAQQRTADSGVNAQVLILRGRPVEMILNAARDADLIIVGTHGYRGLDRALLGSVAETLVRRSTLPVLVVPPRPAAPADAP